MPFLTVRVNAIVKARIAVAALGVCALSAASYAQNSDSTAPTRGADANLAAHVKQALDSDKSLDDRHVDVAVEHGEVVLKGFVQDSRALTVAGELASKAAGNHKIVNHLSVSQNYPNAP